MSDNPYPHPCWDEEGRRGLINELDAECGEWRSVANLLMEAAVKARQQIYTTEVNTAYAEACERVAAMLTEAGKS